MVLPQSQSVAGSSNAKQVMKSTQRDIRSTKLYSEVFEYFQKQHAPAFGKISRAGDLQVSPDRKHIVFTGASWEKLEGQPSKRVCLLDIATKNLHTLTHGPNNDTFARWSPSGDTIAFLSDREEKGEYQLYLLRRDTFGEANTALSVNGSVEYLEWSPDGKKILLGYAGKDADSNAIGGSGKQTKGGKDELPPWMPKVESPAAKNEWRKIAIYDVEHKTLSELKWEVNPWDATWAGSDSIFTIASDSPGEEAWYTAKALVIGIESGQSKAVTHSETRIPQQRGVPAASQDGKMFAFVQGICSDRGVVAADVFVGSAERLQPVKLDLGDVDATYLAWQNESSDSSTKTLFYAGISGLNLVVGKVIFNGDTELNKYEHKELLKTNEYSADPVYPSIGVVDNERFTIILQSRGHYQEITLVEDQKFTSLKSFAHDGTKHLLSLLGPSESVTWKAPDGLEIGGILDLPKHGQKPYPLILFIHGGPVYSYQNSWPGFMYPAILLSRGYAVLSPNVRGSSGRGQAYVEKEIGDVGGGEVHDHLAGIDMLVKQGIVDPDRIGVTGGSHGGFMASWIVTQDSRFKATVPVAAVTHWLSQHFTSNIAAFDPIFLEADPFNVGTVTPYLTQSPVMMAKKTKTPTLQVVGDVDYCVPASQGQQLHNALLEAGVESVLVTYPGEGHGIRNFPAVIDFSTRLVQWFERWMPARKVEKEEA